MRTVFSRIIFEAFVLDEEQVRSIAKILQKYAGEPSISVNCADDATRSFESVDKLLEYENARSRRITSLSLSSHAYSESQLLAKVDNASIDAACGGSSEWNPTHRLLIRVSGTEERAAITKRELDEVIAGSRPWYSWISKINGFFLWWLFAVTLFLLPLRFISFPVQVESISSSLVFLVFLTHLVVAMMSVWPAWGTLYVIRRLFPLGVFLIGQEKAKYNTKERVRWMAITLAITAMVGVVISILT